MFAGNGGSAADAQHFAGELVSRFYYDRPGIAGLALTTDSSILTAIGNDYQYERIFSRRSRPSDAPGDVFVGISTSGRSPNVLGGLVAARRLGLATVGLTGHREVIWHSYVISLFMFPRFNPAHPAGPSTCWSTCSAL